MTVNVESPPDAVLARMMAALDKSPEAGHLSNSLPERPSLDSQPDFTAGALPALLSMNGVWYQVKNSAKHGASDTDLSSSDAHRSTGSVSSGLDSLQEINCSRPELVARLQRQKSAAARPDAVRRPAYVRARDQARGDNGQAESAAPYGRLRKFGSRFFGKFMGTSNSPAPEEKQLDQKTHVEARSSPIASPPKSPPMGGTDGFGSQHEPAQEEPKHEITPLATKIQRSRSMNREPPRRKPVPPEIPQCPLPVRSELPGLPCLAPIASADTTMDTSTVMEGSALSMEDSIIGIDQAAVGVAPTYPLQPPPRPPRSTLRPVAQYVPEFAPSKRASDSDGPPSPVPTLSHGGSDADDESSYSEQDAASPPARALALDAVPRSEECHGLAIGIPKTQYTVQQRRLPVMRS